MKITLFLNETGLSGGIRIALHFADQLRRKGHDVRLVSLPRPRLAGKALWKARAKRSIKAVLGWREALRALGRPSRRVSTSHLDLFEPFPHHELESFRPATDADMPDADVVIATWWETALMAAAFAPSKGVKVHFFQQFDANFGQPEAEVERAWRLPAQKIVCAQWLADLAARRFDDPTAIVVNNGIDLDHFDAPPRGKQPVPTVAVMYSGSAPKGWPTALAVLNRARQHLPNLRILAFGASAPYDGLPLPPGAEFDLLPSQDRIREIYSSADVWLCASTSEGFHLPPHEAMACRTPVVSTRVGGPMDMITDGIDGFLVEPRDEEALYDRLVKALTLPEADWRALSDRAYVTARGYTWEIAGDRFEAALQAAVHRDRGHAVAT